MKNNWFLFRMSPRAVLIFWLIVVTTFVVIYFFAPSLFNEMRQAAYQNTPFVNTPVES